MEDDELQAIRQARMAQLRQQGGPGGGGPSGSSAGPSFASSLGGGAAQRGGAGGRSGGAGDDEDQEQQAAAMEEQKRQMMSRILDNEARERLSRISLVKPHKAQGITNLLIQMAQSGQIRQRVNEEQLIGLLEQVEQAQGDGPGGGQAGKITYNRKKVAMDDSDDDFDL